MSIRDDYGEAVTLTEDASFYAYNDPDGSPSDVYVERKNLLLGVPVVHEVTVVNFTIQSDNSINDPDNKVTGWRAPVLANSYYRVQMFAMLVQANAAADFRVSFSVPSGVSSDSYWAQNYGTSQDRANWGISNHVTIGAGVVPRAFSTWGLLITGATAGDIQGYMAQSVSDASDNTVIRGAHIAVTYMGSTV